MNVFCSKCGMRLSESDNFCKRCGYNLTRFEVASEPKKATSTPPTAHLWALDYDEWIEAKTPLAQKTPSTSSSSSKEGSRIFEDWHKSPNRYFVAALLTIILPGLGHVYRGKVAEGVLWCVCVQLAYMLFILPGLVLHILCIYEAQKPS